MRIAVHRHEHFNAAHRLFDPNLNDAENEAIFGKCSYANYHGHNYELIVKVTGDIDPKTGYVIDMKELSDIIKEKVTDRLDHRNLNLDIEEFKNLNPSAENIAVVIYNILRQELDTKLDLHITLYETPRNFVSYPA